MRPSVPRKANLDELASTVPGSVKGVLLGPVKGLVSNRKGFNH